MPRGHQNVMLPNVCQANRGVCVHGMGSVHREELQICGERAATGCPIREERLLYWMKRGNLLDIDKQGQSSRPLPEAIAVWRVFTREITSLAVTGNGERMARLNKKLIKHYI